jgi:hypothetical protein
MKRWFAAVSVVVAALIALAAFAPPPPVSTVPLCLVYDK